MPTPVRIALLLALTQIAMACAIGTTPIHVNRSPFQSDATPKPGSILVTPLVDARAEDRLPYVGAKRNGYGMVLGHVAVPEGQTLEGILTAYFAEALQASGYQAVVADSLDQAPPGFDPDAIIKGEIHKFWLDLYMATWHNVEIGIELTDLRDQTLWETVVRGDETNVLWLGVKSEFEKVIRQALDKALAQAIEEFSGEDFQAQLQVATEHKARGAGGAADAETSSEPTAAEGEPTSPDETTP